MIYDFDRYCLVEKYGLTNASKFGLDKLVDDIIDYMSNSKDFVNLPLKHNDDDDSYWVTITKTSIKKYNKSFTLPVFMERLSIILTLQTMDNSYQAAQYDESIRVRWNHEGSFVRIEINCPEMFFKPLKKSSHVDFLGDEDDENVGKYSLQIISEILGKRRKGKVFSNFDSTLYHELIHSLDSYIQKTTYKKHHVYDKEHEKEIYSVSKKDNILRQCYNEFMNSLEAGSKIKVPDIFRIYDTSKDITNGYFYMTYYLMSTERNAYVGSYARRCLYGTENDKGNELEIYTAMSDFLNDTYKYVEPDEVVRQLRDNIYFKTFDARIKSALLKHGNSIEILKHVNDILLKKYVDKQIKKLTNIKEENARS